MSETKDRTLAQQHLVSCWSCNGTGVGAFFKREIPCQRCDGTGECPEIMKEWQSLGDLYKAERIQNRFPLRLWAEKIGCDVNDLSRAERGLIDPRTLSI